MAAGGFREFVPGETLDEDKINDFLMQGVLVFAGTAARGSAIGTPVEGQFSFLKDTDSLEFYDGTAWQELSADTIDFDYLVIAGGGGGGEGVPASPARGRGGGGAGGYRNSVTGELSGGSASAESPLGFLSGDSFAVTIGGGGAVESPGSISVFGPVVSVGGGSGDDKEVLLDLRGGSGGGGHANRGGRIVGQGQEGGGGVSGVSAGGGGGGGAGVAGANQSGATGGAGGNGLASSITGSSVTRGGGGGGGGNPGGAGGTGGGGAGGNTSATNGTANFGGGGGGTYNSGTPGAGGSGVVILKYPDTVTLTIGVGLLSSTTSAGGFKVTTFTDGTDTVTVG